MIRPSSECTIFFSRLRPQTNALSSSPCSAAKTRDALSQDAALELVSDLPVNRERGKSGLPLAGLVLHARQNEDVPVDADEQAAERQRHEHSDARLEVEIAVALAVALAGAADVDRVREVADADLRTQGQDVDQLDAVSSLEAVQERVGRCTLTMFPGKAYCSPQSSTRPIRRRTNREMRPRPVRQCRTREGLARHSASCSAWCRLRLSPRFRHRVAPTQRRRLASKGRPHRRTGPGDPRRGRASLPIVMRSISLSMASASQPGFGDVRTYKGARTRAKARARVASTRDEPRVGEAQPDGLRAVPAAMSGSRFDYAGAFAPSMERRRNLARPMMRTTLSCASSAAARFSPTTS